MTNKKPKMKPFSEWTDDEILAGGIDGYASGNDLGIWGECTKRAFATASIRQANRFYNKINDIIGEKHTRISRQYIERCRKSGEWL